MSGMPWQLKAGLANRRKYPAAEKRPLAETLPQVNINDLDVPRDGKTYISNISLRFPPLTGMKINWNMVQFHHSNRVQTFKLKHIKTGIGYYPRHAFICECGKPVIKLFLHHQNLGCPACLKLTYTSQTLTKRTRPALQAARIQSFLDNKPRLYRHIRERLTKRLGEKLMMAQGSLGTQARSLWK
jgi:hypothetical protein